MKNKISRFAYFFLASAFIVPLIQNVTHPNEIKASAVTILTTRSSQSYIDNYYASVNFNQSGDTLKNSLASVLKSERSASFSYGSMQSTAFPYIDVNPLSPNSGQIVSFYSGTPVNGYSGMNKEHTWPNSHGGNKIENDPHVIRPTLTSENSARGNMYYAQSPNTGWDPASFSNEKYRGISARIIFYGATVGASSGLVIEDVGRGQGTGTSNKMGKLGDLLKWNLEYPVDQTEIIRNETLDISLNYNRNPFIDDPSLACKIWGNTNTNTQQICAQSSVELESLSLTPSSFKLNMGNTQSLTVTATPSNASKLVTWSTSNPSVATVNNGIVTPVATGTALITATSSSNASIKATSTVTVTNDPIPVTGVSLNKSSLSLSLEASSQLIATISPSSATNKTVTWTSSNPAVASVSATGLVKALTLGTSTITVTTQDGNYKAQTIITVTEQPITTSIKGSFHNTSDNSSGDGGVTAANINNGISSASVVGFGGKTVVTSVEVSKGYFPRSNGLAIGSSSGGGSLALNLAEGYHAVKVEAFFNAAGITGTTATITGNTNIKSSSNGTIGTSLSNPSDATPYVVEFDSPASKITLTTTKRTALVELVIHYGEQTSGPSALEEATSWADSFLELTAAGCEASSSTLLNSVWNEISSKFAALSQDAKDIIAHTVANGSGTSIEEAVARYLIIVDRYQLNAFIPGLQVNNLQRNIVNLNQSDLTFTVVSIMILVVIVGGFVYYKKRTKKA